MSDAAAFKATFAGMNSLTDGDYSVRFHVSGEEINKLFAVLTHGEKPSVAKGTWFGIARLNVGGASLISHGQAATTPLDHNAKTPVTEAASEGVRSLSQDAFWKCNEPTFRVFLEQRRRHAIPAPNHINNADEAKHVLRAWLDIQSLSELDSDIAAAGRWKRREAEYYTWLTAAKYVEEG